MVSISLCMIVKNEEKSLSRCILSVCEAVDEIIIVDTGSNDSTVEIAHQLTDKVYHFEWIDDFSAARNFAFSKAGSDYCMWLDADDVISHQDMLRLKTLKSTLTKDIDVVMMLYNTDFDQSGNATFSFYRERLVKNDSVHKWQGAIHEAIPPVGNVIYSEIAVNHKKEKPADPDRNLKIFKKLIASGQSLCPREKFYYASELYYHKLYDDAIVSFYDFLSEEQGWVENKIDACRLLAECYIQKGDRLSAICTLTRSFVYGSPRGEICCRLGEILADEEKYYEAIFWFETALSQKPDFHSGSFILPDCYGYIPAIWLCVCFDRLGDYRNAYRYNDIALSYKPDSSNALSNKKYLEKLI